MGVAGEKEKPERTPACNFTEKRKKKIFNLGLDGWLAGIRARHRFSDQSDIKPT